MAELQEVIVLAEVRDPEERKGGMRLNADMKREVLENAIKHGYGKREKALQDRYLALGTKCYKLCVTPAAIKHANALGEPWMVGAKDHYGQKVSSHSINFYVDGYHFLVTVPATLPLMNSYQHIDRKFWTIRNQPELLEALRAYHTDLETFKKDVAKTTATLSAMLARITTYPSLEKNWPAGKKFYEHLPKKYPFRHQVPAVAIEELNAALGLS